MAWLSKNYTYNIERKNPIAINSIIKLSILFKMLFPF
jgi:hypothetical protein